MQPRNKPDHHPGQRNMPPDISEQVENILFAMDSDNPSNIVWVPDNYDLQVSSQELDDIMNDADDTHPNFHRQPTHSGPMSAPSHLRQFSLRSAPSQASHSSVHVKEELQQISPTSQPQTHRQLSHQHITPHTSQSQNLPPKPPTSHVSAAQSHHQRIMLQQHQFQHSSPPHGLLRHDIPVSQHMSAVDLNQAFSLPQTIAGSFPTKQEPSVQPSIPHYFASPEHEVARHVPPYHSPQQVLPLHNDPRIIDYDMYVRRSAQKADQAKLVHRTQLKQEQRKKEAEAEANGSPLTAKDKERERSRRESAVTRKRAEVYISELERVSRRLPEVEQKLLMAETELQRMRKTIADFEEQSRQQHMNTILGVSRNQVKTEPSLNVSPSSERTTTVMNRMQQLDLRLPNTSEAG